MAQIPNRKRRSILIPANFRGKKAKPQRPYKPTPDPVYAWKLRVRAAKVKELVFHMDDNRWAALNQDVKIVSHPKPFDSANVQYWALKHKYND